MKVSQEKYNKAKPKPSPPSPVVVAPPPPTITNNIDMSEVTQSIDRLSGVIDSKKVDDKTESLIFAIKGIKKEGDNNYNELVRYLGGKIDVLVETLQKKPTSFEFDLKRDPDGFINTVLVKPIK